MQKSTQKYPFITADSRGMAKLRETARRHQGGQAETDASAPSAYYTIEKEGEHHERRK